jgi:hypothetical protein
VYKDRSSIEYVGIESESKKSEFINLDEFPKSIVQNRVQEHEALTDSQKEYEVHGGGT